MREGRLRRPRRPAVENHHRQGCPRRVAQEPARSHVVSPLTSIDGWIALAEGPAGRCPPSSRPGVRERPLPPRHPSACPAIGTDTTKTVSIKPPSRSLLVALTSSGASLITHEAVCHRATQQISAALAVRGSGSRCLSRRFRPGSPAVLRQGTIRAAVRSVRPGAGTRPGPSEAAGYREIARGDDEPRLGLPDPRPCSPRLSNRISPRCQIFPTCGRGVHRLCAAPASGTLCGPRQHDPCTSNGCRSATETGRDPEQVVKLGRGSLSTSRRLSCNGRFLR